MCEFKSAVITRDGKVWHSEFTDAHEDIIEMYDLYEGSPETNTVRGANIVRVEFVPDWKKPFDLDRWDFRVDEPSPPEWFTDSVRDAAVSQLRDIASGMMVTDGEVRLVIGKSLLVGGGARVRRASFARIWAFGNATVEAWGNATVKAWDNATVEACGNATVKAWDNATVKAWDNATVEAWGNATVKAFDNATVEACGNATVEARGNATVKAWGNATVEARGNATVEARGNATVEDHRNQKTTRP